MAENKGLGLPQTKGLFQLRGVVTGTQKESFYTDKLTSTGKPWRNINFGVQFNKEATLYVGFNGMEKAEVYFSKSGGKGEKPITEKVAWRDRLTFTSRPDKKEFSPMGVSLGVAKIKDEKGNDVNDKKKMFEFDACKEIADNLVDGKTVFVKGKIEHSKYKDKCSTKFVPSQVSLGKDIDFDEADFKPLADFTQTIVFMGVTPNEDKTKFTVQAKIVNYNSIEDAEFVITDGNLAKMFNKNLKPYTSIKVWGNISVEQEVEEVSSTDCWGTKNHMDKVSSPTIRELVITGADPESIDKDTYKESAIDEAIEKIKASKKAENDFGSSSNDSWGTVNDSWGTVNSDSSSDDDGWD